MNNDAIPDLKKAVASKRIFQFLTKTPTESKAKAFFSKAKQINTKALTTIFEDQPVTDPPENIPDSPVPHTEMQPTSYGNSPYNTSFTFNRTALPKNIRGTSPTTNLLLRSGSLSPKSFMPGRRGLEENNYKSKFHLPMPGTQALLLYPDSLSDYEKTEISKYEQVYFLGNKVGKINEGFTDSNGVYQVVFGDQLAYRYEPIELLGKGTFGHVYKSFDYKREIYVAVKILRKNPKVRRQGENEIKYLEMTNKEDPDDSKCLVRMLQCFEFRGHLCISFELLSINLYQFLRKSMYKGINLNLIKRIALQILIALRHLHSFGLIHSDLKLENILLKNEGKSSIKVIDLGSTLNYVNPLCSYMQSRYYRAPEVIIGAGFDNKIDIWSLGCMLVELFTGRVLFPGENEHDQLIRIMSVIGLPPRHILNRGKRRTVFFHEDCSAKIVPNKRGVMLYPDSKDFFETSDKDEQVFKEFITLCLRWDSQTRLSAEEALRHPFIKGNGKEISNEVQRRSRLNLLNNQI